MGTIGVYPVSSIFLTFRIRKLTLGIGRHIFSAAIVMRYLDLASQVYPLISDGEIVPTMLTPTTTGLVGVLIAMYSEFMVRRWAGLSGVSMMAIGYCNLEKKVIQTLIRRMIAILKVTVS